MAEEDPQQPMQNNTYLDELQGEVSSLAPSSHAARLISEGKWLVNYLIGVQNVVVDDCHHSYGDGSSS